MIKLKKLTTAIGVSSLFALAMLLTPDSAIAGSRHFDSCRRNCCDSSVSIRQSNDTTISNTVVVGVNTGDNEVEKTVGKKIKVESGDAFVNVKITNNVGSNVLILH